MATMETSTVIDRLLAEQRMLTAVERFARRPERDIAAPAQARYYRDLIPLTAPAPGQQFAFEVDLDKCSGCKACVTACHALNGLEEQESWRSVGWLHGGDTARPYQQTVTTACHHCADPGCLNGCPVLAYEKDPVTGIVRHLDDQCIGCQYCVWKCPYEVPRYSSRLGVVRKCDMCHSRLAAGEAPACVQSCPNEAIRIIVRSRDAIAASSPGPATLVPGAPRSALTQPATVYLHQKPYPANARPADADAAAARPEPPHWPLVFMLVLTQLGVGALAGAIVARWFIPPIDHALMTALIVPALIAAWVGLAAGGAHLGQPLRAWKIFLGWRRSWLSREALIFGMFAMFGLVWAADGLFHQRMGPWPVHGMVVMLGLAGIGSSVMIYHDTGRAFWRARHSAPRFLGTTILLGAIGNVTALLWMGRDHPFIDCLLGVALLTGAAKLAREFQFVNKRRPGRKVEYRRGARLLRTGLRSAWHARLAASLAGLVLTAFLLIPGLADGWKTALSAAALAGLILGELGERYLFFTAATTPRMPGGLP